MKSAPWLADQATICGLARHCARSVLPGVSIEDEMSGSLLTAGDVAELLGVPKSWVYEQSRAGRIPTVTLGRYRRYRREAIEAWVAQLESPARGARLYAPRAA
jgi:excisionase family DNA binding protein